MRCPDPYTARTSRTSFVASLWNVSNAWSLSSLDTLLSSLVYVNSRSNRASSRAEISRLEWVQRRTFAHFCFIFESIWCKTCNRKGKTNLATWYPPMEEWPVCSRHARQFCSLFVATQCHWPQLPQQMSPTNENNLRKCHIQDKSVWKPGRPKTPRMTGTGNAITYAVNESTMESIW